MEIELADSEIVDAKRLTAHIERIEEFEREKKETSDLIKDEYLVAKGEGYDPKIMKQIVKLRKRSADEIQEEEAMVELYRSALGML
jgi:uncharacterized protein (UPF0335 family)